MASIGESYEIVGKMLENNGIYPGDPQAFELSSYVNNWGGVTFHVAMNLGDSIRLHTSPHCRDVKTLWTRNDGLTSQGRRVVDEHRRRTINNA